MKLISLLSLKNNIRTLLRSTKPLKPTVQPIPPELPKQAVSGKIRLPAAILICTILFYAPFVLAGDIKSSPDKRQTNTGTLLVLGDSLSAGFGLAKNDGWVAKLKQRLAEPSYQIDVINASVSGETTYGGLSRLPKLLTKYKPRFVIVELGGNDGLQGLSMTSMEQNLEKIVSLLETRGIHALLVGMKLPPNYGKFYTQTFEDIYRRIHKKYNLEFVPFLLQHIATERKLMQADGIHPRAEAQQLMLDNVWPHLQRVLAKRPKR